MGYKEVEIKSDNTINVKLLDDHHISLRKGSSDIAVFKQVLVHKEYEAFTQLMKQNIKQNDPLVILDVGSNIGLTSIYMAIEFPNSKILAVEPDADNFEILVRNTECVENITAVQGALWSFTQKLTLTSDFRDGDSWSKSISKESQKSNGVKVQGYSIADLLNLYNVSRLDVLKMDIEGSEKELFLNADFVNAVAGLKFIVIEIHDEFDCRQMICDTLSKLNFYWTNSGELTIGYNRNLIGNG
jgi:FkbM family methyltransferase